MGSDLYEQIEKILIEAKGKPLTVREIIDKLKERDDNINREKVRRCLQSSSFAIETLHPVKKKNAWIHINYRKNKETKEMNEFELKLRIQHTNRIKEKVIEPFLKQLPHISSTVLYWGIENPKYKGLFFVTSPMLYLGRLDVEDEPLLYDFSEFHVKFKPNPVEELKKFNKEVKKFNKIWGYIHNKIISIIERKITIFSLYSKFLEEKEIKKEWLEKIKRLYIEKYHTYEEDTFLMLTMLGIFPSRLAQWIYENLVMIIIGKWNLEKIFSSYIEEVGEFYCYYLKSPILSPDAVFCGFIEKTKQSKKQFQKMMDNKIKRLIKKIAELEKIKKNILNLHKIVQKLQKIEENIRYSLKKHNELIILLGDCPYYPWYKENLK